MPHRRGIILQAITQAVEDDGFNYLCIDSTSGCPAAYRLRAGGFFSDEAHRPTIVYTDEL